MDNPQFTLPFFLFLFVATLFFCVTPALSVQESFIVDTAAFESYDVAYTVQSGFKPLVNISFVEVSHYQNLLSVMVFYDSTEFFFVGDPPNSAATPLTVKNGTTTIGTGNIGYGMLGDSALNIYIYMDTWNIGGLSGPQNFSLEYDNSKIYNLTFREWYARPTGANVVGLYWYAAPYSFSGSYSIYHSAYWINTYDYVFGGAFYEIDIYKVLGGKAYNSTWIISTDLGEYLNETGIPSASNNTIKTPDAPISLVVYDTYNELHTDTLFIPEPGEFEIAGTVFNAKEGFGLSGAIIQLGGTTYATSDSTGQYNFSIDAGTYNLSCSLSDYKTLLYTLTVNNHRPLNLPLCKNITAPDIPAGTAIIYGTTLEKSTGNPIESVHLTLSNSTYEATTFSNSLGYYEISVSGPDNYQIVAEKSGYYSSVVVVNVTAVNAGYYQLIELINIAHVITPTPTPPTDTGERTKERVYGLFESFGMSENTTNYILALLIILACAGIMAGFIPKAALGGATLGALIGALISSGIGLIPMWFILLLIFIGSLIFAYKFFGEG